MFHRRFAGADIAAALACLALLWWHHDADLPILGLVSALVLIDVAIPSAVLWAKSRANHDTLPAWVERLPGAEDLVDAVAEAMFDVGIHERHWLADFRAVRRDVERLFSRQQLAQRSEVVGHVAVGRRDHRRRPAHDVVA